MTPHSPTAKVKTISSTLASEPASSPPLLMAGDQPNVDSDDENSTSMKGSGTKAYKVPALETQGPDTSLIPIATKTEGQPFIHNKAFTCCIKQYGVRVDEKDPNKANAGEGKRWERKFGLFGVLIE